MTTSDIEDLLTPQTSRSAGQDSVDDQESTFIDPTTPRKSSGVVTAKSFKSQANLGNSTTHTAHAGPNACNGIHDGDHDGFLPGLASVFVKTWGCSHNNSDGEYMAGLLAAEGYNVILDHSRADEADLWVLNSCTVKGPSQQTFVNDIDKGRLAGKKVVVAGCVPQASPSGSGWQGLSVVGVQQIDQVVTVVEETLKGNTVRLLREAKHFSEDGVKRKAGGARLDLPKIRRNPFIEIIPINTGCLNQCTYCKTKHARGDLGSYSPAEIIARVDSVLHEGVKEIWLTSEDTGAYGKDIGVTIVDLLWGILEAMDKHVVQDAMLRVGMTNPPYILEHLQEISKILNHPRVYSFLHVPVQAGSTRVLDDMRRLYTIEDFERVVDVLQANVPRVTIATDIICGFPTETEEDFNETMRIIEKYKFSVLHISQFYARPGTPAARMKRIPTHIVKARSRRATVFFESYATYGDLVGSLQKILVTEQSADNEHYVGHNKEYQQILVAKDEKLMGQTFTVRITKVGKFYMMGEPLAEDMTRIKNSIADAPLGSVAPKRMPKLVRVKRSVKVMEDAVDGADHMVRQSEDGVSAHGSTPDVRGTSIKSRSDGAELSMKSVAPDTPKPHLQPIRKPRHPALLYGVRGIALGAVGLWAWRNPDTRWTIKIGAFVVGLIATDVLFSI
ncbi:hypothetical protein BASA50_000107 [Batrachochytrium salamandrivorans]|uniref:Threonylcarbamoyladenosine tRNA methylthiotransferase n=1 Tax=Batrachochytrium salamandrivorans TaxID=1357716 RepID=A0ABQ8EY49_9FUNG|nr:hypothetical protein BASA60_000453 [Batrachochytrium salamandrivorans]KAH6560229.1 hypothetical protein BASA62_000198 [Batrachochytrium salamandrivorans]KAH6578867.1 hypothetical protein BASA61_000398 [Batrachochytrium salamandrivorans]KAH6587059.1 hypothetical protein BASA50_000107 [Batrachochytrium salamandrivorans]KAJ1344782.1 MiaB-like tRNA modifying enzyme, archaeal-type [Batrachochytrium salamandrivorans]